MGQVEGGHAQPLRAGWEGQQWGRAQVWGCPSEEKGVSRGAEYAEEARSALVQTRLGSHAGIGSKTRVWRLTVDTAYIIVLFFYLFLIAVLF